MERSGKKMTALILTERAAEEIKRVQEQQQFGDETFLRIKITAGGCSGFSYSLGFDKEFSEEQDETDEQHGIKVVVDKKSSLYLDGTTLDYYDGLDKRGFHFENPNATKTCGCGSSFQA
jgi:iron-sulfur cluster assembly protein